MPDEHEELAADPDALESEETQVDEEAGISEARENLFKQHVEGYKAEDSADEQDDDSEEKSEDEEDEESSEESEGETTEDEEAEDEDSEEETETEESESEEEEELEDAHLTRLPGFERLTVKGKKAVKRLQREHADMVTARQQEEQVAKELKGAAEYGSAYFDYAQNNNIELQELETWVQKLPAIRQGGEDAVEFLLAEAEKAGWERPAPQMPDWLQAQLDADAIAPEAAKLVMDNLVAQQKALKKAPEMRGPNPQAAAQEEAKQASDGVVAMLASLEEKHPEVGGRLKADVQSEVQSALKGVDAKNWVAVAEQVARRVVAERKPAKKRSTGGKSVSGKRANPKRSVKKVEKTGRAGILDKYTN